MTSTAKSTRVMQALFNSLTQDRDFQECVICWISSQKIIRNDLRDTIAKETAGILKAVLIQINITAPPYHEDIIEAIGVVLRLFFKEIYQEIRQREPPGTNITGCVGYQCDEKGFVDLVLDHFRPEGGVLTDDDMVAASAVNAGTNADRVVEGFPNKAELDSVFITRNEDSQASRDSYGCLDSQDGYGSQDNGEGNITPVPNYQDSYGSQDNGDGNITPVPFQVSTNLVYEPSVKDRMDDFQWMRTVVDDDNYPMIPWKAYWLELCNPADSFEFTTFEERVACRKRTIVESK